MGKKQILENNRTLTGIAILIMITFHASLIPTGVWHSSVNSFQIKELTEAWQIYITLSQILHDSCIPTLLMISGYNFCHVITMTDHYDTLQRFMQRKIPRLIIPLAFTTMCWLLPFRSQLDPIYRDAPIWARIIMCIIDPAQLWYLYYLMAITTAIQIIWKWYRSIQPYLLISSTILYTILPDRVYLITTLLFFSAGIFIYQNDIIEKINKKQTYKKYTTLILFASVLCRLMINLVMKPNIVTAPVPCTYGLAIFCLLQTSKTIPRLNKSKFSAFLQKHSFCIYLFHEQIMMLCIHLLSEKLPAHIVVLIALISTVSISLVLSKLLHLTPITRILIGEYQAVKQERNTRKGTDKNDRP